MTRQLISTIKQPMLRSPHAKRPPPAGFVQVGEIGNLGAATHLDGFGVYQDLIRIGMRGPITHEQLPSIVDGTSSIV